MHRMFKRLFLLLLFCVPAINGLAQTQLRVTSLALYKTKEDEEWFDSEFPLVASGTKSIDEIINSTLQMEVLGMVLNDKNIKIATSKGKDPDWSFGYAVYANNPRLLIITITRRHIYSTMSVRSDDTNTSFYFDTRTGRRVWIRDLFSRVGYSQFRNRLSGGFSQAIRSEGNSFFGDDKGNIADLDDKKTVDDCVLAMPKRVCDEQYNMKFGDGAIAFELASCAMMNPGPRDPYVTAISTNDLKPMLSEYGQYLLLSAPAADNNSVYGLWKGTIGTIPFSFMLSPTCASNEVTGSEIYDKVGTALHIDGKLEAGGRVTFNEYDNGKIVGVFNAVIAGNTMTGTWTKGDKSKTLPLKATLAETN